MAWLLQEWYRRHSCSQEATDIERTRSQTVSEHPKRDPPRVIGPDTQLQSVGASKRAPGKRASLMAVGAVKGVVSGTQHPQPNANGGNGFSARVVSGTQHPQQTGQTSKSAKKLAPKGSYVVEAVCTPRRMVFCPHFSVSYFLAFRLQIRSARPFVREHAIGVGGCGAEGNNQRKMSRGWAWRRLRCAFPFVPSCD
jgi:hypothetical protein